MLFENKKTIAFKALTSCFVEKVVYQFDLSMITVGVKRGASGRHSSTLR